ncbi:DUF5602 domain-containing protein [Arenibacter sp. F26102]|uniref:DUF5602 domain-containing protein n=1 Tax=Arenibacter sp. F26102 TaxID=2926416 RepID=UPI001FF10166|nr:DUF5602 domain-containing protein [Arenibacter sp. F26102]MCK0145556.1 DUF5602 domain-containing protein [Arenibacter sp. F26102]
MGFKHLHYIGVGLIFLLTLLGCSPESTIEDTLEPVKGKALLKSNTFYGPQISLGKGHVRSWLRLAKDGTPEELGVEMSKNLLNQLPEGDDPVQLVLPLHKKAKENTPFDHIFFDWNPHGHEPEGVFTAPHFDVHFYLTSVAAREAIPTYLEAKPLFDNYPPPGYLPVDYETPPDGGTAVPMMGTHWIPTSFVPPFSNILLYGSYDGEVTFVEPMNTVAYIDSGVPFTEAYSQPAKFAKTSYYPTVYNVYRNPKDQKQIISLSEFVHREAE